MDSVKDVSSWPPLLASGYKVLQPWHARIRALRLGTAPSCLKMMISPVAEPSQELEPAEALRGSAAGSLFGPWGKN
jgi:hypothetical protein